MAYQYNCSNSGGDNHELISWIIVVGLLVVFWPVGLLLLFRKLGGKTIYSSSRQYQHPYDREYGQASPSASSGFSSPGGAQSTSSQTQDSQGNYHYKYEYRYQAQAQPQPKQPSQPQGEATGYSYTPGRSDAAKHAPKSTPGMQGVPNQSRYRYRKPVNLKRGKAMTVWGAILTGIFGLGAITSIPGMLMSGGFRLFFAGGAPILGLLSLGIVLMVSGMQRGKKAKRFRKYLALIGKRDSIAIGSLAQAMPISYRAACEDLQEMLDEGYIPTGYLDMSSGRLILSDEGLREETPQAPESTEVEDDDEVTDSSALLDEIKQINDAIADPEMSRKIDHIGEITAKILDYQHKNPGKAGQLRSFLSYYLPTTLKILRAYSQMESQGIEGENIRSAKQRIEGMMDKVVEGFEKQLDRLFQGDAMDITTDVEVLERMLDKDGLSDSGDMFQIGG